MIAPAAEAGRCPARVSAERISKTYKVYASAGRLREMVFASAPGEVHAVRRISFALPRPRSG
jgi:hypothetical protein